MRKNIYSVYFCNITKFNITKFNITKFNITKFNIKIVKLIYITSVTVPLLPQHLFPLCPSPSPIFS